MRNTTTTNLVLVTLSALAVACGGFDNKIARTTGMEDGAANGSDPQRGPSPGEGEGEGANDANWGTEGEAPPGGGGGGRTIDVGIGQGGAQDFGVFRRILDEGGLPLPETLDDAGFFAEHHTSLPPADCGEVLCLHGLLGVMGNLINGSNCTMLQLAMNARVDEEQLERKPLNLAVTIDVSGSMRADGKIDFVRQGLQLMLDNLEDDDVVTLVTYSSEARVVAEGIGADRRAELRETIAALGASGGTNLYDGLELAFEEVRKFQSADRQNRVILLSDGRPTVGITDTPSILEMAAGYTEEGIGLTTIGVGAESNPQLLRVVSELGSGNFYFLEDESAIEEVFVEELAYFVTPIATDLQVSVTTGGAYGLREVFGTKLWATSGSGGSIEIPSVFIAHRQSHDDQEQGRRGGGSAILAEMLPRLDWPELDDIDPGTIATIEMSYLPAGEVLRQSQTVTIEYPHEPGQTIEGGFFSVSGDVDSEYAGSIEKNFVMMNIYVGFRMASERVERGDLDGALSMLENLETGVAEWDSRIGDEDIEDDLAILRQFVRNLLVAGAGQPDDPPDDDPWPRD